MTKSDATLSSDVSNDNVVIENRGMHGFSIPAYTYHSCKCEQIRIGPAYTCMDDQGYFWNCPGCEDMFKTSSPEEEGGQGE